MSDTAVQVSNPTTQGDINQAVSLVVQDKLQKAGITDQTLSELKSELQTLSEIDVIDEASFKLVHGGTMKATSARTTITKICKAGREYAIAEQKAWIAAERENIAAFSSQEAALKAKKEAWIAHKERVEREALEAQERAIRARFTALEGFGFTRRTAMAGGEDLYTNGETTLAIAYVAAATDEVWNNLIKGIEMAWMEQQDRLKAEEEARAAEKERIRLAQEAIEEGARKLKEQQDAFNAKINEARKNELLALGCELDANGDAFVFIPKHVSPLCPDVSSRTTWITADLHLADPWQQQLDDATKQVGIRDARIKENEEFVARKALIASRVKALKEAGWQDQTEGVLVLNMQEGDGVTMTASVFTQEVSHLGDMPDDVFLSRLKDGNLELARRKTRQEEAVRQSAIESERQRVAMQAKLDEQARAERQARMGDVEKIEKWMSDFTENAPALASAIGKSGVASLVKSVTNAGKKMIQDIQA